MIHMVRAIRNILDKSFYAHNILCGYYYTFFSYLIRKLSIQKNWILQSHIHF